MFSSMAIHQEGVAHPSVDYGGADCIKLDFGKHFSFMNIEALATVPFYFQI